MTFLIKIILSLSLFHSFCRFTEEKKEEQPSIAHMPFDWGPRNCVGMRFSLMETKLVLIATLTKFKFLRAPETEVLLYFYVEGYDYIV